MSDNLQQRLDAFVSGECSPDAFVQELSVLCDATPDSAWDVLSLIDQYYRRGKLSAELFQTVRYRIERHALGVRDPDAVREASEAPMATEAAVGAARGVAVALQERAATPKEPASDVRALQNELLNARATVQRYRRRLAILVDFGHRTRSALANAQRELRISRSQAIELLNLRGTVQRYRRRLAILVDFGHRTRSALANTQRELGISRSEAIELLNARATVQRYRRRLATLADFGHRTRSALTNAQRELRISRTQAIELLNLRGTVQRYRRRLAILGDFAHRTRSALANTRRELDISRGQAMDYYERLRSSEWRRAVREQINGESTGTPATRDRVRIWRPARSSQAVALAAVLLGVGASPALQDSPRHRDAGNIALPTAPAVVIPQVADPGQLSLSTDKYVVFPGHASAEILVQRTGGASGDVSFVWWTQGSGARPGRDYVSGTPRTAHLLDGVDTLSLSVPILANPSRKHTELFYVGIGRPGGGASLGPTTRATVFIMRPD